MLRDFLKSFSQPFFGFIQGHSYISDKEQMIISHLVEKDSSDSVKNFELSFASLIGEGDCVSYAAARMGFYEVMTLLNLQPGDEVILLGSTCSVMSTSVLKTGATPIYSDIDPVTFGSCPIGIRRCISDKTKMIVAQHSFGIPCDIEGIKALADEKGIFLLEDCALTLGSTINGFCVGNFGDAALFSTDHSKPLNTITGGLIYSKKAWIIESLKSSQLAHGELPLAKKRALWLRFIIEKRFCNPSRQRVMILIDIIYAILIRLKLLTNPFLSDDFSSSNAKPNYPFPSKLPEFLAKIGLLEINRWAETKRTRKQGLQIFLDALSGKDVEVNLSDVYRDPTISIIPLRFVWTEVNGEQRRLRLKRLIRVSWTWFMVPIVATREPLENYNYIYGSCPIAEKSGRGMVNLPSNLEIRPLITLASFINRSCDDKVL